MQKHLYPLLLGIVAPLALIGAAVARRRGGATDGERRALISIALVLTLAWTLRSREARASALNQSLAALALVGAGGMWAAAALRDDDALPALPEPAAAAPAPVDASRPLSITGAPMSDDELSDFMAAVTFPALPPSPVLAPPAAPEPAAPPPPVVTKTPQLSEITQERAVYALNKIMPGLGDAAKQGRASTAGFFDSAQAQGHGWVSIALLDFARNEGERALKMIGDLGVVKTGEGTYGLHVPVAEPPPVVDITAVVEYAQQQHQQNQKRTK